MTTELNEYQDAIEMQQVAIKLASLGLFMKVVKDMTQVKKTIIKDAFNPNAAVNRGGDGWLNRKGDEKTNADRILRFLLKAHGNDLSTLNVDDPKLLLKYYETYVASHPTGYVDICRFYTLTLDLVSARHPIMKCGCCKKPYITLDARIRDCGVCNDIISRQNHMKRFRKRRKEAAA